MTVVQSDDEHEWNGSYYLILQKSWYALEGAFIRRSKFGDAEQLKRGKQKSGLNC